MNLSFRPATEADALLISKLADKIWRQHYPGIISEAQIDYMLLDRYSPEVIVSGMKNGEKYFLAYADGEAVAYTGIEPEDGFLFLNKFYVDVSKHRKGIGEQFFRYVLSQVDSRQPMRLQVNRRNIKAVNFYFKMGFIIENTGDFDIGGGFYMNDFVMLRKGN